MRLPLLAVAFCALAVPASAQQVALSIKDGLVTLEASNASVRQILAEWARVGRVTIVNGEKVAGTPVTLQLAGVSERQALDTLLRGVAGYMVSARPGTPDAAQTLFDKVVILPTSAAPVNPPPPSMANARQPVLPPAPQVPDPDDNFDEEPDDLRGQPGFPQPAGSGGAQPVGISPQAGQMPNPGVRFQVPVSGYPQGMVPPAGTPVRVLPPGSTGSTGSSARPVGPPGRPGGPPQANPFGGMGSGTPGSVTPLPPSSAVPLSPTNPSVQAQ